MSKGKILEKLRSLGKARVIFGILLACWMPWGVFCFPGNLPWDAGTSIAWFLNLDRSNVNNPWFQNLWMGLFFQAGNLLGLPKLGIYLYCWLQMILEAWLLGKVIAYLWDRTGAGKAAGALVPFFALLPVFPIYAFMMGKDSGFALALLAMVYLLIRAAEEGDDFWEDRRSRRILAALPAVLGLQRNFGGVIPLGVFIILVLKARKKKGLPAAGGAALALLAATVLIPRLAGIPPAEIKEEMSIPLQTAAFYVQERPEEVTEEEWETISRVVEPRILIEEYHPMIADPIKDKSSFTAETRAEFLRMWAGLFRKHPDTILEGWKWSTHLYFSLTQDSEIKSHVFIGVCCDPALQEKLGIESWEAGNYFAKGAWTVSMQVPVVRTLQRIGGYSWILCGLALLTLAVRRLRKFFPCCVVLGMVLAACMLSPVNGYYRYAYPMILSLPAVLWAAAGSLRKRKTAAGTEAAGA